MAGCRRSAAVILAYRSGAIQVGEGVGVHERRVATGPCKPISGNLRKTAALTLQSLCSICIPEQSPVCDEGPWVTKVRECVL